MPLQILKQYEQDEFLITEYTRDGTTISHIVRTPISTVSTHPFPTIAEQILIENQYQTALLEMSMLGGM